MACALLLIVIVVTIIACLCKIWCFKRPEPRKQKGTDLADQNQARNQDTASTGTTHKLRGHILGIIYPLHIRGHF